MTSQAQTPLMAYRFDNFYLDAANRRLLRDGQPVALNSKYFDVLLLLVSRRGQLVEKASLFEEIWSGVFVTDAALTQCIKDIRKQLGDDAANPRYIKTVPKHGYVFIGEVTPLATEDGRPASVELQAAQPSARPYKFLDYYTERDVQLFFGREAEVESVASQIGAHRSFILHGRSGVGKSSLLRAGLTPRLKAAGHHVFIIRSFTDPLNQMTAALTHLLNDSSGAALDEAMPSGAWPLAALGEGDVASLIELIGQAGRRWPNQAVVFFLDQFEEFFTLLGEETRARFLDALRQLFTHEALPFRLLFALREDLLAEMSQLKAAIPEIFHHEYRLKRLSREQAAVAITAPARAVGCHYDGALVARLLDDLNDRGSVDPPQLQIVCDHLYDARSPNGELTLALYAQLGGASQILASYLERVLRRFNAADLVTVKAALTSLISSDGQRLVLRAAELVARVRNTSPMVELLIEELVAARVVRRRSQDGEAWVELAHDFLTPEVSRWLTADEIALKQARAVIERAMENYSAHGLLIDTDTLDLLLPFGEQLNLMGDEADLLLASLLARARAIPAWLIAIAPAAARLIAESSRNADAEIRKRAIEAAAIVRGEPMRELLRELALWDKDLMVRKAASIALADWLGLEAAERLAKDGPGENAGPVRRAISLAMIRDYDKRLVELGRLPLTVALLVVGGLMWVRLRRGGAEIVQQSVGGTLGGLLSGLLGGLLLSIGLSATRHATVIEAMELLVALGALGSFIGGTGGLGVSAGMIAAARVAYRHSRWWAVVGGAAGGAAVGGSSYLLGVDMVNALFGKRPIGITGAMEGAVIGVGVSLGVVLAHTLWREARAWRRIIGAGLGGMVAGVLLIVIGGNLFSGSLEVVARLFANSQMRLDTLAPVFGEVHFGQTTQLILGALEGLLFGVGMASGIEAAARRQTDETGLSRAPHAKAV
ncbi:MAG TPA: winged helix-turn-helix domain-containing protein [Blastocatellia bacterium]|nr:winged helix-turn-helix domain-containing protein [Blastocatellia bacterium]